MIKHLKHLLAALCCVALVICTPSCYRKRNQDKNNNGKVVKETKYKKETKVKKEKKPKKMKKDEMAY